ncbi:MAG: 4'-phosphopantetheinyl transferase superfamily protein, partial [Lysobacteraceae bacterium]
LDGVAAIVLSPAEYRVFTDCTPDDRLELFLSAWTRKEAYLKARGEGLARSPALLECSALLGSAETIRDRDDDSAARRWSVMTWCEADYRAALVAEGPLGTVTFK